jgi:hypothetical protein
MNCYFAMLAVKNTLDRKCKAAWPPSSHVQNEKAEATVDTNMVPSPGRLEQKDTGGERPGSCDQLVAPLRPARESARCSRSAHLSRRDGCIPQVARKLCRHLAGVGNAASCQGGGEPARTHLQLLSPRRDLGLGSTRAVPDSSILGEARAATG